MNMYSICMKYAIRYAGETEAYVMATLQVKGMDDRLYQALAARAAGENRSISQEVVTIIRDFLARPGRPSRQSTEEFLALCGTWADDRPASEIAAELRRARRSSRRRKAVQNVFD
jgi:plasmid stability protein